MNENETKLLDRITKGVNRSLYELTNAIGNEGEEMQALAYLLNRNLRTKFRRHSDRINQVSEYCPFTVVLEKELRGEAFPLSVPVRHLKITIQHRNRSRKGGVRYAYVSKTKTSKYSLKTVLRGQKNRFSIGQKEALSETISVINAINDALSLYRRTASKLHIQNLKLSKGIDTYIEENGGRYAELWTK